jgi:hypothetical protein
MQIAWQSQAALFRVSAILVIQELPSLIHSVQPQLTLIPGSGIVRLNNATQNAATEIYIDDEDNSGANVSGVIALLAGGNNPSSVLGYVTIRKEFAPENFITMKITTLTSASGYTKLVGTVEASSGATPFSDTDNLYFSIDVSGDKGDPGDLSGPGSSTDNAVVRWDGTSGATTQNSSVTIDDSGNVTTAGRIHSTTTGFRFPDNTDQTTAGVIGPASSTDNALVRFDGAGGSAVQNSGWILSDANALTAGGDFDMSGYDLTVDFSTIEAAGEHAEEIDANATGTVTIQATDPTVLRRTLTGDVTLHVAGAPTPGKGWSTELRTTQDGTGGRDLTILPANLLVNTATLSTQSVTVTADAHTLSFYGTGTVTLSGVSTAGPLVGTGAGDRVTLTFTPTGGSLTLTVSGTVSTAQLVLGSAPLGYIAVGATRAASVVWRGGTAAEIDYAAQAAAVESPHHHRRRVGRGNPDRRRERGDLSMIIRKIGGRTSCRAGNSDATDLDRASRGLATRPSYGSNSGPRVWRRW